LWKTLLVFLIPLVLSNALQSLSSTVGSIYLGRLIGVQALAAVSTFFPLLFFLISFLIGIGSGSTVLIGQAYGAGRQDYLKAVAGTTLAFTLLLGVVLAALGVLFNVEALTLIGAPANILDSAAGYARIMFWGLPIVFLYTVYTTFLRGTGDSRTPFYFLAVSTALGLLLTPALILGWAGLPRLGLNGAAYASIFSAFLTFLLMLAYLHLSRHPLRLDREVLRHLRLNWPLLKTLLKIGIPTGVQMIMVSLSEIAIVSLVNRFGSAATAAYGAYYQVANYVQMPAVSLGIAVSIFGAQAIGAGRSERLRRVIGAGFALNLALGGTLVLLCYLFATDILGWFLTDLETLQVAHRLLMITLWSYLVFGGTSVITGIMRSSGTVFWPTVLSIFSIWAVEVPAAYILARKMGIDGIWVGYAVAFVAGFLLQYGYYRTFWREKRHGRLIPD
jgi:putative MATE family efflux protein